MIIKKTTKAFVFLLCLVHILLCLSFQVHISEARLCHLGVSVGTRSLMGGVGPSPTCGSSPRRGRGGRDKPCRQVPRPPRAP
ncbi:unnamed protein product [Cochlearia groenlandica]